MAPACRRLPGQAFGLKRYESQSGVSSGHQGPFLTPARSFADYTHFLHALFWGLAEFWGSIVILSILILFASGILSC